MDIMDKSDTASGNVNTEAEAGQAGAENKQLDKIETKTSSSWQGNSDYFQTGKKAGTMRPRAANKGKTVEQLGGLDIESLRATPTQNDTPAAAQENQRDKKAEKAEKKLVEAKVASKMVMRVLDMLTAWVSKGQYGADFNDAQRKHRNKYREELEQDWQDYLITLDIPMHPALVAVFGSLVYVQDAFNTPAGVERTKTLKEKIIGWGVSKVVGGK
jgi:hypothetical protein